MDGANNIYIVGYTEGDFAGTLNGIRDMLILKYDATGTEVGRSQPGGPGADEASSVAVDSNNNIYVVGQASGDFSAGIACNTTGLGVRDAILIKYNSAGTCQCISQFGTTTDDIALSVAVDGANNIYVAGTTIGNFPGPAAGGYDAFVHKFDSSCNGQAGWPQQFGSSQNEDTTVEGITTDAAGNVYVVGNTLGDMDDTGPATHAGGLDLFVVKFNANGVQQWLYQAGTTGEDRATAVDVSGTTIHVAGYTNGALNGSTQVGDYDYFYLRLQDGATPTHLGTRLGGTTAPDYARGIRVHSSGRAYIVGETEGNMSTIPGNGYQGQGDAFVTLTDENGTTNWTRLFGTSVIDGAFGVGYDSAENFLFTGYTFGNVAGTNAGSADIFAARLNSVGSPM